MAIKVFGNPSNSNKIMVPASGIVEDVFVFNWFNKWPTYTKCFPWLADVSNFFREVTYTAWCENGEVFVEIVVLNSQACILEGYDINGNIKYTEEFNKTKIIKIPPTQSIEYVKIINKSKTLYSRCIYVRNVCELANSACLEYTISCNSYCGNYPLITFLNYSGSVYVRVEEGGVINEYGNTGGIDNPYGVQLISNCSTPGIIDLTGKPLPPTNNVEIMKFCMHPLFTRVWIVVPGFKPVEIDLAYWRKQCIKYPTVGLPGGGGQP